MVLETQFVRLFTRLEVGMFRATWSGRLLSANGSFLRLLGMTSPENSAHTWHLESMAVCQVQASLILEELRHYGQARFSELEIHAPGGGTLWIRLSQILDPLTGKEPGEEEVIEGMIEDITELKRRDSEQRGRDEERIQAQKMESIGRLAGGVAHDFNNMLTAINGYSELLLGMLGDDDPIRENLVEIRKAGIRAAHLTRELLAFSRRQLLLPKIMDMNDLVLSMDRTIQRAIGDGIEMELLLDSKLDKIKCDPGQMENVIMNLVFNARDAMGRGGTLLIHTANVEVGAPAGPDSRPCPANAALKGVAAGAYISLTVSDTGSGMDPETLSRVFEPFFSTKPFSKAAGMGLAMVHGIVKQSGGHIFAESNPGKGSCFRIYLPRVAEDLRNRPRALP